MRASVCGFFKLVDGQNSVLSENQISLPRIAIQHWLGHCRKRKRASPRGGVIKAYRTGIVRPEGLIFIPSNSMPTRSQVCLAWEGRSAYIWTYHNRQTKSAASDHSLRQSELRYGTPKRLNIPLCLSFSYFPGGTHSNWCKRESRCALTRHVQVDYGPNEQVPSGLKHGNELVSFPKDDSH